MLPAAFTCKALVWKSVQKPRKTAASNYILVCTSVYLVLFQIHIYRSTLQPDALVNLNHLIREQVSGSSLIPPADEGDDTHEANCGYCQWFPIPLCVVYHLL